MNGFVDMLKGGKGPFWTVATGKVAQKCLILRHNLWHSGFQAPKPMGQVHSMKNRPIREFHLHQISQLEEQTPVRVSTQVHQITTTFAMSHHSKREWQHVLHRCNQWAAFTLVIIGLCAAAQPWNQSATNPPVYGMSIDNISQCQLKLFGYYF